MGSGTAALVQRATKRLETAKGALVAEDFDGAFTNAYDVYRMPGEALLLLQGLRATGGDGSQVTVEDAVCAQFSGARERSPPHRWVQRRASATAIPATTKYRAKRLRMARG